MAMHFFKVNLLSMVDILHSIMFQIIAITQPLLPKIPSKT